MRYKAVKELDGTYSIRASVMGMNYSEVLMLGVRPCNVEKTLARLNAEDFKRQQEKKREAIKHNV